MAFKDSIIKLLGGYTESEYEQHGRHSRLKGYYTATVDTLDEWRDWVGGRIALAKKKQQNQSVLKAKRDNLSSRIDSAFELAGRCQ